MLLVLSRLNFCTYIKHCAAKCLFGNSCLFGTLEQSISNNLPVVIADVKVRSLYSIPISIFISTIMVTNWCIGVLVMTLLAELQLLPCAFHSFRSTITKSLHHCTILYSGFAAPQPLVIFECLVRVVAPFFTTLTGATQRPIRKLDYKLNYPQTHQFLGIPALYLN